MSTATGSDSAANIADNRHAGSIRLPSFDEKRPKVWFQQIEEQFVIYGVNDEKLMFAHMVGALPTEAYSIARAAVILPTETKYTQAKQALITAYSKNQYTRYLSVLETPPLGDQKLSILLRSMLEELDPEDEANPGTWVRWLWFSRLPEHIREHLLQPAMLEGDERVPLHALAALADLRHNKDCRRVDLVAALSDRPASSGSRRTGQDSTGSKEPEHPDWCYFHNRFGSKAKKCKSGCQWKAEN